LNIQEKKLLLLGISTHSSVIYIEELSCVA
jgi:hypothetical protein